jgi:hypothetical protein
MPTSETCPLYPSMLKQYCSHCQGTSRATRNNPRFSVKRDSFDGAPMIEIFKDGGAIHLWDSHFRFGLRKAEIVVTCIDVLREFWRSDGAEFTPRVVANPHRGLRVRVFVELHLDFERSDGELVDRPWLHLQSLTFGNTPTIGLGLLKCRAICEVEADIRTWLCEYGLPYKSPD